MPRTPLPLNPRQKRIGSRVAKARKSKSWSQYKLAIEARVSRSTIKHVEEGRHCSEVRTLDRIAEALDVSVSFLLS